MESSTSETWVDRVERWRASGERAETFSRREGYAASTLRWWSSKLKRDMPSPVVQLARVVRTSSVTARATTSGQAIVLEVVDAGVRISVEPGADPTTLAMVLDVVGARVGGRR